MSLLHHTALRLAPLEANVALEHFDQYLLDYYQIYQNFLLQDTHQHLAFAHEAVQNNQSNRLFYSEHLNNLSKFSIIPMSILIVYLPSSAVNKPTLAS